MRLSRITTVVPLLSLCALLMFPLNAPLAADNGDVDFAKGWDLLKLKKYKEARTALEAGMKKNPANVLGHFYLADACRELKDWSCAQEHYETSLELDANSSVADLAKARLAEKPTSLDGWQNAKFGMTLDQVKTAYPGGKVDVEIYRNCKSIAKEILQPTDYSLLFEELEARLDAESPDDCVQYNLSEYSLGRDKWHIEFRFSKTQRQLDRIKLSIRADTLAYEHYKQILVSKYGQGREERNTTPAEAWCKEVERRLSNNLSMRFGETITHTHDLATEFLLSNGWVRLTQQTFLNCTAYERWPTKVQEWAQESAKIFPKLKIEYQSRPSVAPADMKNF